MTASGGASPPSGERQERFAQDVAAILQKRDRDGGHLHHRDCIHNLPPVEQIEMRGRTVEWWEAMRWPLPVQITPDDWETEPLDIDVSGLVGGSR